jgi:hypothetical protein
VCWGGVAGGSPPLRGRRHAAPPAGGRLSLTLSCWVLDGLHPYGGGGMPPPQQGGDLFRLCDSRHKYKKIHGSFRDARAGRRTRLCMYAGRMHKKIGRFPEIGSFLKYDLDLTSISVTFLLRLRAFHVERSPARLGLFLLARRVCRRWGRRGGSVAGVSRWREVRVRVWGGCARDTQIASASDGSSSRTAAGRAVFRMSLAGCVSGESRRVSLVGGGGVRGGCDVGSGGEFGVGVGLGTGWARVGLRLGSSWVRVGLETGSGWARVVCRLGSG